MPTLPRLCLPCLTTVLLACCTSVGTVDGDSDTTSADSSSDTGPSAPTSRVGGANKLGDGWLDWSDAKQTPEILKGPQGGQHIWVSARTWHLHPKKARVAVTMYLESPTGDVMVKPGRVEVTGTLKLPGEVTGTSRGEGSYLLYSGLPSFVKEPCKIKDKRVRVELEVSDLHGVQATDKAWIYPVWTGYCDPVP